MKTNKLKQLEILRKAVLRYAYMLDTYKVIDCYPYEHSLEQVADDSFEITYREGNRSYHTTYERQLDTYMDTLEELQNLYDEKL